jgi:hypothetical protein
MRQIQIAMLCAALLAASVSGCRKGVDKTTEKAIGKKAPEVQLQKSKVMTIKSDDGETVAIAGEDGTTQITTNGPDGKQVVQTFEKEDKSGKVTIIDENGNQSTYEAGADVTAGDVGLPFYPGATLENGTRTQSAGFGEAVQAVLLSNDGFDSIRAFYGKVVPDGAFNSDAKSARGHTVMHTWKQGGVQFSISIIDEDDDDGVKIVLNRIREKE